jgi:hypothetical protein
VCSTGGRQSASFVPPACPWEHCSAADIGPAATSTTPGSARVDWRGRRDAVDLAPAADRPGGVRGGVPRGPGPGRRPAGLHHHRGDTKDPGPDQSLAFARGHELWQLQSVDPDRSYVAPARRRALTPGPTPPSWRQRVGRARRPGSPICGRGSAGEVVEVGASERGGAVCVAGRLVGGPSLLLRLP